MSSTGIETEKKYVATILKEYGNQSIDSANERWANRKRTNIIRTIAQKGRLTQTDIAEYLGITKEALYLKNTNNRFTIDDMMAILYACDFWMTIQSTDDDNVYKVFPVEFFSNYDEERLKHLAQVKQRHPENIEAKRKEYEALKEQLKSLKESYGFED